MKKILLSIIAVATAHTSFAQWQTVLGTNNIYYNSGNVGVGTSSATEKLTARDQNITYDSSSGMVKLLFDSGNGGGGVGFEKETFNTGGLRFFTQYGWGSIFEKCVANWMSMDQYCF